jgi:hypothetical protein
MAAAGVGRQEEERHPLIRNVVAQRFRSLKVKRAAPLTIKTRKNPAIAAMAHTGSRETAAL